MARFNREDSRTVLPQLEKELREHKTKITSTANDVSTLEKAVSKVGDVVSVRGSASTTDITATAGSFVDLGSVTLEKGVWVITCRARFTPSASGNNYTTVCIGSISQSNAWYDRRFSQSTYVNQHSMSTIVRPSEDTTYFLVGGTNVAGTWNRQNDSSFNITAVRIA